MFFSGLTACEVLLYKGLAGSSSRAPATTLLAAGSSGAVDRVGTEAECAELTSRLRAEDEATFLPPEFTESVSVERCRRADGVQAPVLFRIPLLRSALLGFGCCTPATKRDMGRLFSRKIDFGILPGGMEEVALYTRGRERVYLRKRAGFIKYALQHGYLVQPAYTFGECDLYTSLQAGRAVRMYGVGTVS